MSNVHLINLNPTRFKLKPGEQAEASLSIRNISADFQTYQVVVQGGEPARVTLDRKTASAISGQETEKIRLTMALPATMRGGNYPLIITAVVDNYPDRPKVEAVLLLEVDAPITEPGPVAAPIMPIIPAISQKPIALPIPPGDPNILPYAIAPGLRVKVTPAPELKPEPAAINSMVELTNTDAENRIIDYSLSLVGLPATWVSIDPPQVPLNSNESGKIRLTLRPTVTAPVGVYRFSLRVYSHLNPAVKLEIPCTFEVKGNIPKNQYTNMSPQPQDSNPSLLLVASERSLVVNPGGENQLGLTLRNQSLVPLTLDLRILGLPKTWHDLNNVKIDLAPNQTISYPLKLKPSPETLPGAYPLTVLAQVRSDPNLSVRVSVPIEITETKGNFTPAIQIKLDQDQTVIKLDRRNNLEFNIRNLSVRQDVYYLRVEGEGLNPNWLTVEQSRPQIAPFAEISAKVKFQIPLDAGLAGSYPIRIRVFSDIYPNLEALATSRLEVPIAGGYTLNLTPPEGRGIGESNYQLEVNNLANAPLYLKLAALEQTSSLIFRFNPPELDVPAKGKMLVPLLVNPRYQVSSDAIRDFQVKSEGYFKLTGGIQQLAEPKQTAARHLQEVPPTLIVSMNPLENQTDHVAYYEVRVNNSGTERSKIRFQVTNPNPKLSYTFEPPELTVNPKEEGKTSLTVSHRLKATSDQPEVYHFRVQAGYAGEGVASVVAGFADARMIYRALIVAKKKRGIGLLVGVVLAGLVLAGGTAAGLLLLNNNSDATPTVIGGLPTTIAGGLTPAVPTISQDNGAFATATAIANNNATAIAQGGATATALANGNATAIASGNSATITAQANMNAAATVQAGKNATATAQANLTATATAQANLTATAKAGVTATAQSATITANAPGVRLDLLNNPTTATWCSKDVNDASCVALPFPGSEADNRGFALLRENFTMEDNTVPKGKVLEMHPKWVTNGLIMGIFPSYTVKPGEHFKASVGFLKHPAPGAQHVLFRVEVVLDNDIFGIARPRIAEVDATYDSKLQEIDIDLSSAPQLGVPGNQPRVNFVGRSVRLRFVVIGLNAGSGADWAAWVNPRIEHP